MLLIIQRIICGNNKKMNLKKIDIIKINNNMYQVQQNELLKKAQIIFSNGLKSQQRLSKNMINKANTTLIIFYDGKYNEEIKKKDYSLVPSKYIEFINRDENNNFDDKMMSLKSEFTELLKEEEQSKKELLNVFKKLGYEIEL